MKADCIGPAPADAPTEQQGLGWKNKCGTGTAPDAMTSGLEGAWTATPTAWSIMYRTTCSGLTGSRPRARPARRSGSHG